jgi:hypothetical protein
MENGEPMFLKRVDGPRQVTLPDGSILTRADLPPADTRRWVASRKAIVVKAVVFGLITLAEALSVMRCRRKSLTSGVMPSHVMATRLCG